MKRAAALLAPLALLVAVGCGGESSLDAILQGEGAPASEGGESTGGDDASTSVDDSSTSAADTAPAAIPGDAEAYCRLARSFDEAGDEINEVLDTFTFDADLIREAFSEAGQALGELAGVAPSEIRGEITMFREGFARLFAELEAVDFNFFALDFEALEELSDGFDEAGERIEEYNERVCGIPRTTFDDEFGGGLDDLDLDDLDLGALEDAFGELGEVFGDLEDFDMGDFGSMFADILTEQYLSEGYSPEDARCLAEATFDFEELFGAIAEGDATAFEDFEDPFTRCGVTPRN